MVAPPPHASRTVRARWRTPSLRALRLPDRRFVRSGAPRGFRSLRVALPGALPGVRRRRPALRRLPLLSRCRRGARLHLDPAAALALLRERHGDLEHAVLEVRV